MSNLELTVRFLIHEPRAPGLPYREEHFGFKHNPVEHSPCPSRHCARGLLGRADHRESR